jgi:hypothetical protein
MRRFPATAGGVRAAMGRVGEYEVRAAAGDVRVAADRVGEHKVRAAVGCVRAGRIRAGCVRASAGRVSELEVRVAGGEHEVGAYLLYASAPCGVHRTTSPTRLAGRAGDVGGFNPNQRQLRQARAPARQERTMG